MCSFKRYLLISILLFVGSFSAAEPARSLFDELYSRPVSAKAAVYSVPDGFAALIADLQSRVKNPEKTIGLFYPFGRSLQRYQAIDPVTLSFLSKDQQQFLSGLREWTILDLFDSPMDSFVRPFFRYPRLVVGFDSEPKAGQPLLAKKMFLGFNERSKILEIISFNRTDGQFEFQKVLDFVPGGKKEVVYPPRALCLRCHQNEAPIFARGIWMETQANSALAFHLKKNLPLESDGSYLGFSMDITQATPERFDRLTDQASLLPVYQKLWRICATRECRALALSFMLRYRLESNHLSYRSSFNYEKRYLPLLEKLWGRDTVFIASPNIPFRDPLSLRESGLQPNQMNWSVGEFINFIPPELNPVAFSVYEDGQKQFYEQPGEFPPHGFSQEKNQNFLVEGVAKEFFSVEDIKTLQQALIRRSKSSLLLVKNCRVDQEGPVIEVSGCKDGTGPSVEVSGNVSAVSGDSLTIVNDDGLLSQMNGMTLKSVRISKSGDVLFDLRDVNSEIEKLIEFAVARFASLRLETFRSNEILRDLYQFLEVPGDFGTKAAPQKIYEHSKDRPEQFEQIPAELRLFEKRCATCHSSADTYFASFMTGSNPEAVKKNLERCAPRIWARLSYWSFPHGNSVKYPVPMPLDGSASGTELEELKARTAQLMAKSAMRENQELIRDGYLEKPVSEVDYYSLPACRIGSYSAQ